eukprot:366197-Chlamydomonas_euryale.AAC.1
MEANQGCTVWPIPPPPDCPDRVKVRYGTVPPPVRCLQRGGNGTADVYYAATRIDGCQRPRYCCDQTESKPACGHADAECRGERGGCVGTQGCSWSVLQKESRREVCVEATNNSRLHSNVLGDGNNQAAPCQGTLGF